MSNKNRNRNRNTIESTLAITKSALQHCQSASPFEQAQLQNLQSMIELLATQLLSSMKTPDTSQPAAALPQLRVYAQYLNLYMKFKDKCVKGEKVNGVKQSHTASSVPTISARPAQIQQTPSAKTHSSDDKRTQQIQESIQRVIHKTEPSQLLPNGTVNGLLMP